MGLWTVIGSNCTAQRYGTFACRAHRAANGTSCAVLSSRDQVSITTDIARATLTSIANCDGRSLTCFHITTRAASTTLATVCASNRTERVATIATIATNATNACLTQDHTCTACSTRRSSRTAVATVTAIRTSDSGGTVGGCDSITAVTTITAMGTA